MKSDSLSETQLKKETLDAGCSKYKERFWVTPCCKKQNLTLHQPNNQA